MKPTPESPDRPIPEEPIESLLKLHCPFLPRLHGWAKASIRPFGPLTPMVCWPRYRRLLLADTKTTRRSCSSVGIRPLEIAAPVLFGLLVIRRTLFKRNPICGFEGDRLCGRAGPHIRRFDELRDEKRSSTLASPLHASACMDRGLYLKAAVQVRDANPTPQGPQPCEGALAAQVGA